VGQALLSAAQAPPSATTDRREEEPQSFNLFKLGQKVGGCITGLLRRVKARSQRGMPLTGPFRSAPSPARGEGACMQK